MEPLPPSLAAALRPVLPSLAEETITAIGREVPDYRRPLEGPFGQALRTGVESALARFVDAVEDPAGVDASAAGDTYVGLGMLEFHAGRSLDALLSAYRLGARLAWERFLAAGRAAGHDPEVLFRLAGAIFTYIDQISAESVEGYARERSAAEAEQGRRRRALVRLLADADAAPEA
ncbi:MAG: PucR family transcriptional regulator, partial [Solirubrobacterales bacterium]|nr:PucR family transcriptional regulator [Solirubrobacterales bacterium]